MSTASVAFSAWLLPRTDRRRRASSSSTSPPASSAAAPLSAGGRAAWPRSTAAVGLSACQRAAPAPALVSRAPVSRPGHSRKEPLVMEGGRGERRKCSSIAVTHNCKVLIHDLGARFALPHAVPPSSRSMPCHGGLRGLARPPTAGRPGSARSPRRRARPRQARGRAHLAFRGRAPKLVVSPNARLCSVPGKTAIEKVDDVPE